MTRRCCWNALSLEKDPRMGPREDCTKGKFVAPGMRTKYQPANWKIFVGLNTLEKYECSPEEC